MAVGPAPGQVAGIIQINVRVPALPAGTYKAYVGYNMTESDGVINGDDFHSIPIVVGSPATGLK